MSKNAYTILKLSVVIILASIVAVSVSNGNWYLPIISMLVAFTLLYASKKKVKAILEDERDYKAAGNAARWAMNIYTMVSVVLGIFLYVKGKGDAVLYFSGNVLLYSALFLMFLYSVLFKVFIKKDENKN